MGLVGTGATISTCRTAPWRRILWSSTFHVRPYASAEREDALPTTGSHDNASIKPNENFINRNPRNLERLAYAEKDWGWGMEWPGYARGNSSNYPRRFYYHRLVLRKTGSFTHAEVQHHSGNIVASASTREWCIRRHLYNDKDVTACYNLGRIIASRCLRAGISSVSFRTPTRYDTAAESASLFAKAAEEEGLVLEEPQPIEFGHTKPHHQRQGPEPPEGDG